jgi:hypothetical protein
MTTRGGPVLLAQVRSVSMIVKTYSLILSAECFTVSTLAHFEIPTDHMEYSYAIQPQDSPRVDDSLYKHGGGFNRDHPTVTPLRWSNWWTTSGDQPLLSKDSPHLYDGELQISDDHSCRSPEKRSRTSPTNCTLRSRYVCTKIAASPPWTNHTQVLKKLLKLTSCKIRAVWRQTALLTIMTLHWYSRLRKHPMVFQMISQTTQAW